MQDDDSATSVASIEEQEQADDVEVAVSSTPDWSVQHVVARLSIGNLGRYAAILEMQESADCMTEEDKRMGAVILRDTRRLEKALAALVGDIPISFEDRAMVAKKAAEARKPRPKCEAAKKIQAAKARVSAKGVAEAAKKSEEPVHVKAAESSCHIAEARKDMARIVEKVAKRAEKMWQDREREVLEELAIRNEENRIAEEMRMRRIKEASKQSSRDTDEELRKSAGARAAAGCKSKSDDAGARAKPKSSDLKNAEQPDRLQKIVEDKKKAMEERKSDMIRKRLQQQEEAEAAGERQKEARTRKLEDAKQHMEQTPETHVSRPAFPKSEASRPLAPLIAKSSIPIRRQSIRQLAVAPLQANPEASSSTAFFAPLPLVDCTSLTERLPDGREKILDLRALGMTDKIKLGIGSQVVYLRQHGMVDKRIVLRRVPHSANPGICPTLASSPGGGHVLSPLAHVLDATATLKGYRVFVYPYCTYGSMTDWAAARQKAGVPITNDEAQRVIKCVELGSSALVAAGFPPLTGQQLDDVFIADGELPLIREPLRMSVVHGSFGNLLKRPAPEESSSSSGMHADAKRPRLDVAAVHAGKAGVRTPAAKAMRIPPVPKPPLPKAMPRWAKPRAKADAKAGAPADAKAGAKTDANELNNHVQCILKNIESRKEKEAQSDHPKPAPKVPSVPPGSRAVDFLAQVAMRNPAIRPKAKF